MSEASKNPQALLAETSWLRSLARELAHDPNTAEDLVQETMLAALKAPAPTRAKLRTWLEAVARRLSAGLYRSDDRRRTREQQVARVNAVPSAADMLDQFSLHRDVVEAVVQLTEPTRTAVLMRFWHGLPPRRGLSDHLAPAPKQHGRVQRVFLVDKQMQFWRSSSLGSFLCDVDGLVPIQKDCRAHERSVCAGKPVQ